MGQKKGFSGVLSRVFRGEMDDDEIEQLEEELEADAKKDLIDHLGLDDAEARDIASFHTTPTWKPFVLLLRRLQSQSDMALRYKGTSADDIRHHQGRIAALNEITLVLRTDLPSCYKKREAKKGGR